MFLIRSAGLFFCLVRNKTVPKYKWTEQVESQLDELFANIDEIIHFVIHG